MAIQITALPSLCTTPAFHQKVKCNIARKSGHKYVSGNTFKQRTYLNKLKDFIGTTRGVNVLPKAYYESKHYVQAALLRKDELAHLKSEQDGPLTDEEYDALVWNSGGVQNRANREDHVRYNDDYFDRAKGASQRNAKAHGVSLWAHKMHGGCEMAAAPTGMTTTVVRSGITQCTDEKSTKNKAFMFGLLAFVGLGTWKALSFAKSPVSSNESLPKFLGESLLGAFIAFPAVSSLFGALGTILGMRSQSIVERQQMGNGQKKDLQADLNTNMNQLLHILKSMHGKPEIIEVSGQAMQGQALHIFGKIDAANLDTDKVPLLLKQALAAIDLNKSDAENIQTLKRAVGSYLQVEKPQDGSRWARYCYAKAVTKKESHFVALLSLIEHSETKGNPKNVVDTRRGLENEAVPRYRRNTLRFISHGFKPIDGVLGTKMSSTLAKWATEDYAKKHAAKMADPRRAAQNCFKGEYMVNNMHQYGSFARTLMVTAEGLRIFNMNIVLASNANLSRIFNNAAMNTQRAIGTGPASRSMCQSVGRCLGGALLAVIFGTVIPSAVPSLDIDLGTKKPIELTVTNIGIVMFVVSVPTLFLMCAAQGVARLEGWKGDVAKQLPPNKRSYNF